MKAPAVLFILGLLLVWLGITGRLGVFMAALFTPTEVN